MSLGEQIAIGYGILSVLATALLLLMAYWQYKKPKPKLDKQQPIFFRLIDGEWKWFVQLANGEEIGPFKSEETAKDYRAWYNRYF